MEKINLFWAAIWSIVALSCVVAIFWNPAHFITLAIAIIFAVMFWYDYHKTKGL